MARETHPPHRPGSPESRFRPLEAADLVELCRPSKRLWTELSEAGPLAFEPLPDIEPEEDGPRVDPVDELLRATVRDVLYLDGPEPEDADSEDADSEDADLAARSSVRHASNPRRIHALEHSPTQPLTFADALLETARYLNFSSAQGAVERMQTGRSLVHAQELSAALAGQDLDDSKALADAYLADELRLAGRHLEAENRILAAKRELHQHSSKEIRARILEIESDLASTVGSIGKSLRLLDEAESLLADCPIVGRSASLLLRRARTNLARRWPDKALEALRAGQRALPDDRSFRLRLELAHTVALACLSLRDLEETRRTLEEAAPLYDGPYSDLRLESQRWWLEGHLAMASEGREQAERAMNLFGRAIEVFIDHSQTRDAFRTFVDWTLAAEKASRLNTLEGPMQKIFLRLLEMPNVTELGRLELSHWIERAAGLGVDIPSLERLREKYEAPPTGSN